MMKSERKSICSLLGDEVAHSSTVNKDVDRSMIERALEGQGFLGPSFIEAADFESVLGLGFYLSSGPGFQKEVWWYRA